MWQYASENPGLFFLLAAFSVFVAGVAAASMVTDFCRALAIIFGKKEPAKQNKAE
jgi:hypothetical protein